MFSIMTLWVLCLRLKPHVFALYHIAKHLLVVFLTYPLNCFVLTRHERGCTCSFSLFYSEIMKFPSVITMYYVVTKCLHLDITSEN